MGPQLYRCGNGRTGHKRHETVSGFNGAATLSLRKSHADSQPVRLTAARFNGAATLSLRKCPNMADRPKAKPWLQWGRNFIVAEISQRATMSKVRSVKLQWGRNFIVAEMITAYLAGNQKQDASMGPQLYRCGNIKRTDNHGPKSLRFNGAATLSLRKLAPRPHSSANAPLLQWGRNFIVAEILLRGACVGRLSAALQWGRNFIVAEIALKRRICPD